MTLRHGKKKWFGLPDPKYQSILLFMLIQHIIRHGKKILAYSILFSIFRKIQEKTHREPFSIVEHAVRIVIPKVQLKSRRIGGTAYQFSLKIGIRRGFILAIQWIFIAARFRPEHKRSDRVSEAIIEAVRRYGPAVNKRSEVHRIAEANKVFVRSRFSLIVGILSDIY